ncbi:MAG: HAMP domain-containing histidine kinase, partial [Proteobacteria bacterium]|nr:HAMP domain-containing histidine kinase [Pseudomonadota bacterium]
DRELNCEKISVAAFATSLADVVEPKAGNACVDFVREIPEDLGEFEVDAGVLSSALVNILENAVEACATDKAKPDHAVRLGVQNDGPDVVITVADNGTGMSQETSEKMFTLFFSSKGDRGTGLGLFIANQVIEKHGGNITVNSTLRQGTTFTIRLPRKLAEAAKRCD